MKVHEIACCNGTGYFLVAQGSATPAALSCFAADATHAADVKAMTASLMSGAGTNCSVQ